MTLKINNIKKEIDSLNVKLEKKEEERKLLKQKNQLDFDEDEMPEEDIIDEEELVMLKSLKDLKREYRENFS